MTPTDLIPALWHYTCAHGADGIDTTRTPAAAPGRRLVRPGLDGYVWATDLDHPVPDALGLTNHLTHCDRTEFRYRIDDLEAVAYFRPWLIERRTADPLRVEALESSPGAMPRHWFVATTPVWAYRS
jgi:hypothetical protein